MNSQLELDCQYSKKLMDKLAEVACKNSVTLDFALINKAIYWARKYHDGQYRKSGEPFYTHPLEVAYLVSDYLLKTDVIIAGILHDIVEDTEVTIGMILDNFGWRIAEMVDMLTRDRPDGTKLSVEQILENAYKKNDKEVLLIKLIDRLHNIQTIGFKTAEKQIKICDETEQNIIGVAASLSQFELEKKLLLHTSTITMNETVVTIEKKYNILNNLTFSLPDLPQIENE